MYSIWLQTSFFCSILPFPASCHRNPLFYEKLVSSWPRPAQSCWIPWWNTMKPYESEAEGGWTYRRGGDMEVEAVGSLLRTHPPRFRPSGIAHPPSVGMGRRNTWCASLPCPGHNTSLSLQWEEGPSCWWALHTYLNHREDPPTAWEGPHSSHNCPCTPGSWALISQRTNTRTSHERDHRSKEKNIIS